jgi:hypothetical protein
MGKYWLKIGLGAAVIFLVGFSLVSAARRVHDSIMSGHGLTIPLGGFIPFKLDGAQVGSLRSLTIHRGTPHGITGFDISARVSDTASLEQFRDCHFSVSDASHIDERTTFVCLKSDSGYLQFGEVRISQRTSSGSNVLVQQLYLPEATVRDLQREGSDSLPAASTDSMISEVQTRVREQQRAYEDSVNAARLERRAKDMQRRADSLRAKRPS